MVLSCITTYYLARLWYLLACQARQGKFPCVLFPTKISKVATLDPGIAAKYMMTQDNDTQIIQANLKIDHDLLQELKHLGVVQSQYDLSRLCGKGRSYYSCMRAKGFGLKLGSLTFLSARLGSRMKICQDPEAVAVLKYAQKLIQQSIEAKCQLQEQGLWRRTTMPRGVRRVRGDQHADWRDRGFTVVGQ